MFLFYLNWGHLKMMGELASIKMITLICENESSGFENKLVASFSRQRDCQTGSGDAGGSDEDATRRDVGASQKHLRLA